MPVIYSTMTSSVKYTKYKPREAGQPHNVALGHVLIKGGANVADRHLHTPRGVATSITQDEYEFLKTDPTFKQHLAKGHVTVSDADVSADKVAKDMTPKDASAPKTPTDYIGKEGPKPQDMGTPVAEKSVFQALKDKVTG